MANLFRNLEPVKVSPLIKFGRYVALGLGIFYGMSKQKIYEALAEKHHEHDEHVQATRYKKLEEEKTIRKEILEFEANKYEARESPVKLIVDPDQVLYFETKHPEDEIEQIFNFEEKPSYNKSEDLILEPTRSADDEQTEFETKDARNSEDIEQIQYGAKHSDDLDNVYNFEGISYDPLKIFEYVEINHIKNTESVLNFEAKDNFDSDQGVDHNDDIKE